MLTRRMFTPEEAIATAALRCVTFPVASWDKRFARSLDLKIGITEKEAPQLWRLFLRYRRQIDCPRKDELLKLAEQCSAPDFRRAQAAARALERIDELKKKYDEAMARV